jgi:hypothetical protein
LPGATNPGLMADVLSKARARGKSSRGLGNSACALPRSREVARMSTPPGARGGQRAELSKGLQGDAGEHAWRTRAHDGVGDIVRDEG